MALLLFLLLALVPWLAWRYARTNAAPHLWAITGIAFGLVISPLSLGLYATFFASPVGLPTAMLGLVSTLFHGSPGFHAARWLGLIPPNEVVSGVASFYVEALNGLLWALFYGSLGFVVDRVRLARSRAAHAP